MSIYRKLKYAVFIALGLVVGNQFGELFTNQHQLSIETEQKIPSAYFDVLIYGDEIPGICAAIGAKKVLGDNGRVALIRSNEASEPLGGVVTRSWLVFADLDKLADWQKQPTAQCFNDFLKKASVAGGSFDIKQTDITAREILKKAGVTIISGSTLKAYVENQEIKFVEADETHNLFQAHAYIDATQNAELARTSGLSYFQGFESYSPKLRNATLSISIIPKITGLTFKELAGIEINILMNSRMMSRIKTALIKDNPQKLVNLLIRGFYSPMYQALPDSYDARSIALGAAFHLYSQKPLKMEKFFFDRGNISIQKDGSLVWNAFLLKYTAEQVLDLEENGRRPTQEMVDEIRLVENWMRQLSGKKVKFYLPREIYVRHSLNIRDVIEPLTGDKIIKGGTLPKNSIGSFSYEFDVRGGIPGLAGKMPSRPVFNFGIENCLANKLKNLAIVGRSSGYIGLAPAVGRILTLNAYQGAGVGVAAGLANRLSVPLNTITSQQVRKELERLTGLTTPLHGREHSALSTH